MSLLPEHYPVKRTYGPGPDGAGLRPLLVKQSNGDSSPLSPPLSLLSRLLMHAPYARAEAMGMTSHHWRL